ncbi:MAG: hypothetical protein ABSH03_22765, partial [Candidatus Lustribacter sp.]
AAALDERFRLLTGGSRTASPHRQTLRGMLDWSYELLDERERSVVRRCGVFAGGFDLDALQNVVADGALDPWDALDALQALVDKSLVVAETFGSDRRYRMLETAREYAFERLDEAGEVDVLARRHAEHFAALASATYDRYWSGYVSDAFDALTPDRDNLRAVLAWALGCGADLSLAARLCGSLAIFWNQQGVAVQGLRSVEEVVARLTEAVPIEDRAHAWTALAFLVGRLMMHDRAIDVAKQAAALARAAGLGVLEARALSIQAMALLHLERHEDAAVLNDQITAIAAATGDARSAVSGLERRAFVAAGREAWTQAEALLAEVLAIQRSHGAAHDAGVTMYNQAEMAYVAGDTPRAIALAREGIELCGSTEAHRVQVLLNLTGYLIDSDRLDEAAATLREALALCERNRYPVWGAFGVQYAAEIALRRQDRDAAARLLRAAEVLLDAVGGHRGPGELRSYNRVVAAFGPKWAQERGLSSSRSDLSYDAANAEARRIVALV